VEAAIHRAWRLPRRPASAAVARRVIDTELLRIGVTESCRAVVSVVVTEACANAICHAQFGAEYLLTLTTVGDRCVIEVIDSGVGFDHDRVNGAASVPPPAAEQGRGLLLIRHFTDTLELRPAQPHGLTVRMGMHLDRVPTRTVIDR